jgi:hypothetical protein
MLVTFFFTVAHLLNKTPIMCMCIFYRMDMCARVRAPMRVRFILRVSMCLCAIGNRHLLFNYRSATARSTSAPTLSNLTPRPPPAIVSHPHDPDNTAVLAGIDDPDTAASYLAMVREQVPLELCVPPLEVLAAREEDVLILL